QESLPMRTASRLLALVLPSLLPLTATAQMTGNVVKIGILNDQSGLYADLGGQGSVTAAKMAVEEFGGKVNGVPVEVISADHQNKPDIGSGRTHHRAQGDGRAGDRRRPHH